MRTSIQITKREVLRAASVALLGNALGGMPALAADRLADIWPAGVQLWMLSAELSHDLPGTLALIKRSGYDVVETAGTQGLSATDFGRLIEDAGLTVRSAHTSMGQLTNNPDQEIETAVALGVEWLVCSAPQPPVPPPAGLDWVAGMTEVMTADAWKTNADHLKLLAPKVKGAGLKLAYHNHLMEFRRFDAKHGHSQTGLDLLLAGSDADSLRIELDIGWSVRAGENPIALMRKYADRLDLLHVKDVRRGNTGFHSVELGRGIIDYRPIFREARRLGVKQYFLEQDPPFSQSLIAALTEDRQYLSSM